MASEIMPTICDITIIETPARMDRISLLLSTGGKEQVTGDCLVFRMRREDGMSYGSCYYPLKYKNFMPVEKGPFKCFELLNFGLNPPEYENNVPTGSKKDLMNYFQKYFKEEDHIPWQGNYYR